MLLEVLGSSVTLHVFLQIPSIQRCMTGKRFADFLVNLPLPWSDVLEVHAQRGRVGRLNPCGDAGADGSTRTYTYVHTYIHTYIHIYIYTHTNMDIDINIDIDMWSGNGDAWGVR